MDRSVLCFLQQRGVISKEFFYRFLKAMSLVETSAEEVKNRSSDEQEWMFCPAQCGRVLATKHSSYETFGLGQAVNTELSPKGAAIGTSLRLGKCACGALICGRCYKVQTSYDHFCSLEIEGKDEKAPPKDDMDVKTKKLLAKVGKNCPGCGNFIEKNEGCNTMMCGTNAHGRVGDALRNGGCALIFYWSTLKPLTGHFIIFCCFFSNTTPPQASLTLNLPIYI